MKLQSLKQRKAELDKLLYEKNNLLQQLCRDEAQLLGCYPSSDGASMETVDGGLNTLRRKVDTSFKLSENLLNNGREDDVHKLLLAKQIQQQISEASLKMANDPLQTKVYLFIDDFSIVFIFPCANIPHVFVCFCLIAVDTACT